MLTKTNCSKCGVEYHAASATLAVRPDRLCFACITAWAETKPCPDCGAGPIRTSKVQSWFQYGRGAKKTFLKTMEYVRICKACDFTFLDHANEELHLMATNRYLAAIGQPLLER